MSEHNFDSSANSDRLDIASCADVTDRFGDYVDLDLSEDMKATIDNHLASCPECAASLESYRGVVEVSARLREPERPISVAVQNRLRKALNDRLGISLPYIA